MKKCCKCGEIKSKLFFHKNKTRKDGLNPECKSCRKKMTNAWNADNRDMVNAGQLRRANVRIKNGLCKHCTNKLLDAGSLCEKHWYQDVSRRHLGTTKFWIELKSIAERQNYQCIYTGEKLIPSLNMSLDHIVSQYNNKSLANDISNFQWVTKRMNMIKNSLSHDELIDLCFFITERFK